VSEPTVSQRDPASTLFNLPGYRVIDAWVRRTIKVAAAPALLDFSGAVQVAQIRRTRTVAGKKSVEVVYAITTPVKSPG